MQSKIELRPLQVEHLELVRQWRNSESVSQFMEFQQTISEVEQKQWFEQLKNALYFLIFQERQAVGVIHLKNITLQTAESGLFIGEKTYLGTGIALHASIQLLDLAFYELKLHNVTAKVHYQNRVAIQYNQLFGFELKIRLNDAFELWELKSEVYTSKRAQLLSLIL